MKSFDDYKAFCKEFRIKSSNPKNLRIYIAQFPASHSDQNKKPNPTVNSSIQGEKENE